MLFLSSIRPPQPKQLKEKCNRSLWHDAITNKELISLDVDVFAPCAMENAITRDNVDQIKAKLIVEGANGPTTAMADEILNERGITTIPDVLANAGGVTVSYLEWVQSSQSYFWGEDRIRASLKKTLLNAYSDVNAAREKYGLKDLRTAAMAVSVKRVAKALELRGVFP